MSRRNTRLRGDEPAGRKRAGRLRRSAGRTFRQRSRTDALQPLSRSRNHRAGPQPPHHGAHPARRAGGHRLLLPLRHRHHARAGSCAPTSSAQAQQTCSSRRFSGRRSRRSRAPASNCSIPTARWAQPAARRWAPATTRRAAKRSLHCAGWRSWNPPKLIERRWKKVTGHGSGK